MKGLTSSNQQEGSSRVHNPGRIQKSRAIAVAESLVDAPVLIRGRCLGNRDVVDVTNDPCVQESELSISGKRKLGKGNSKETHLELSTPPNVNSPLATSAVEVDGT
jgi:hypothetical protein